jgi:hypothetical protein
VTKPSVLNPKPSGRLSLLLTALRPLPPPIFPSRSHSRPQYRVAAHVPVPNMNANLVHCYTRKEGKRQQKKN